MYVRYISMKSLVKFVNRCFHGFGTGSLLDLLIFALDRKAIDSLDILIIMVKLPNLTIYIS